MDTVTLLRVILARDAVAPPVERWDAAAWEAVHAAVIAWDAAPLAASAMRAAGLAKHVPPSIFEAWRRDHLGTTAVNMRLAFEADALVKAIAERGARAAKLKGTALFELGVYRDPGARPTSDIDLIIGPEGAAAAREAIFARGYAQWIGGGPKHWPPFQRDGLLVEVHDHALWSLADGHRVGLAEMIDVRGKPAIGMLVAHLLHHCFESSVTLPWLVVKTLADLAEVRAFVIGREEGAAIAEEIARAAARLGLTHRLRAMARLLARVLDREAPEAWVRSSQGALHREGDDPEAEIQWLLRRAAPRSRAFEAALRLPDRILGIARMPLEETGARIRHALVPPADTMRLIYGLTPGSPWVWALYPWRPLHLLGRSGLDAARLLIEGRRASPGPKGARTVGPPSQSGGRPEPEVDPARKKA